MANQFENALKGGLQAINSLAGQSVTYTRSATILTIKGYPATAKKEAVTDSGSVVRVDLLSWVIRKSDLGALFPPARNDSIVSGGMSYKVVGGPENTCFDYCDSFQNSIYVYVGKPA